jgi:hypothetical protein
MNYNKEEACQILERTPAVLNTILRGLPEAWTLSNEGPETFSPFDVIGHLIHGELTDWRERTMLILQHGTDRPFTPFDRFAQYELSKGKTLEQLLDRFAQLRAENMQWFRALQLETIDLDRKGMHPVLNEVSLRNLLSTWVVHDLTHIAQITRVMAKQYKQEIGPWAQFFRIIEF